MSAIVTVWLRVCLPCFATVHKHPLKEVEIGAIIHGALSVRAKPMYPILFTCCSIPHRGLICLWSHSADLPNNKLWIDVFVLFIGRGYYT